MAFDILKYNEESTTSTSTNEQPFWTQTLIKKIDSFLPKVNEECEYLKNHENDSTKDAFENKIKAWKDLMVANKRLYSLYKVK